MWSLFWCTLALAEPDTFYLGTGRDGAVVFDLPDGEEPNAYAALLSDAAIGASELEVQLRAPSSTPAFVAGDLIMLHQAKREHDESPTRLGGFELARIAATSGTHLLLTRPLVRAFSAATSQVVRVPEYTSVALNMHARVYAARWDGKTGGVLAMLVQGEVSLAEDSFMLGVDGFRGAALTASDGITCENDEGALPDYANGGEASVLGDAFVASRRARSSAGGGGSCVRGGGGGGGGYGSGGNGGGARGGEGGIGAVYSPDRQLVFGGGGGGGHGTLEDDAHNRSAMPGGGAVFLRAESISYSGGARGAFVLASADMACSISPACIPTPPQTPEVHGAGGGGGGGTVHVRTALGNGCESVVYHAMGGEGSATIAPAGGGGGGGGGAVFTQAPHGCADDLRAAGADAGGGAPGASAGALGLVHHLSSAFRVLPAPSVAFAGEGPSASFVGQTETNASVVVYRDGRILARIEADATGRFRFTADGGFAPGTTLRAAMDDHGHESAQSVPVTLAYVPCTADAECTPGFCDAGACKACDGAHACAAVAPVCDRGECRGCIDASECPAHAPVCAPSGLCGACSAEHACEASAPFCDLSLLQCRACLVDAHCASVGSGLRCIDGACQCSADTDCGASQICVENTCVAGCRPDASACAFGQSCSSEGLCVSALAPEDVTETKAQRGCQAAPLPSAWLIVLLSRRRRR